MLHTEVQCPPLSGAGKDKSGDKLLQRQDWFRCTKHQDQKYHNGSGLMMFWKTFEPKSHTNFSNGLIPVIKK